MNWRSSGPAPTFPRPTMLALLGVLCILATVPSTEALPLSYSSLPSLSSPSGLLLAIVSVAIALSLVVALVLGIKRFVKKMMRSMKRSKKAKEDSKKGEEQPKENIDDPGKDLESRRCDDSREREQWSLDDSRRLEPPSSSEDLSDSQLSQFKTQFYKFLENWDELNEEHRNGFIAQMVRLFPVAVTPAMVMDALKTMLQKQVDSSVVHADVWFRMLRFIVMLDRHLCVWDQTKSEQFPEGIIPRHTHQRFQQHLVGLAKMMLRLVGDVARPGEDAGNNNGFLRLIAFLFGFVCKDKRILKVMEDTWYQYGLDQRDASRAVVWGYRRWQDDRRPLSTMEDRRESFYELMQTLKRTATTPRLNVGSKAQHILFALGFGSEPEDAAEGPLAYMCKEYCTAEGYMSSMNESDYMWLMRGRDLGMGNAWDWMCEEALTEHDRMCRRFGLKGYMYGEVVDMVMTDKREYFADDEEKFRDRAVRYSPHITKTINFDEKRSWYARFSKCKRAIGAGIMDWLSENGDWYKKNWYEVPPIDRPPSQFYMPREL